MTNIKRFYLYRNKYLNKPMRSWMFVTSIDKGTVKYFNILDVFIAFSLMLIIIPPAFITFIIMFGPFILWISHEQTTIEQFNEYLK